MITNPPGRLAGFIHPQSVALSYELLGLQPVLKPQVKVI
jgi:hypothetical protein